MEMYDAYDADHQEVYAFKASGKVSGSTSHYDYVCNEVSKGIATVSLESGVPVLFGVLTTENIEQAIERAGTKAGNKGYDCAVSAIEMVNLLREMDAAAE